MVSTTWIFLFESNYYSPAQINIEEIINAELEFSLVQIVLCVNQINPEYKNPSELFRIFQLCPFPESPSVRAIFWSCNSSAQYSQGAR